MAVNCSHSFDVRSPCTVSSQQQHCKEPHRRSRLSIVVVWAGQCSSSNKGQGRSTSLHTDQMCPVAKSSQPNRFETARGGRVPRFALSSSFLSLEPSSSLPNASVSTTRTTTTCLTLSRSRAMRAAGLDVHALAHTHYTTCAPRLHAGSIRV
jgi:hypothetical protein